MTNIFLVSYLINEIYETYSCNEYWWASQLVFGIENYVPTSGDDFRINYNEEMLNG